MFILVFLGSDTVQIHEDLKSHTVLQAFTSVSEERVASIFRARRHKPEDPIRPTPLPQSVASLSVLEKLGPLRVEKFPAFYENSVFITFRFEVLTAVSTSILFLRVLTPCKLAGRYRRFGET
jgi:hypothetical protein